jgi:hypothetical protein
MALARNTSRQNSRTYASGELWSLLGSHCLLGLCDRGSVAARAEEVVVFGEGRHGGRRVDTLRLPGRRERSDELGKRRVVG